MKVAGEREFTAPLRTVWGVLNDPGSMAATMPGIESFDVKDDRHWRANVKIPLGLGGLKMSVDFTKLEEREPEYAKLQAKGNGVGAIMNMETQFHLSEAGGGTHMRWEADVNIGGPVGSMGQRVLQPIVNQQVTNVLNSLEKQVNEAAEPGAKDAGPPADSSPATEPQEGTSGAEEGLNPLAPESYESDPQEPTTSTEDRA
jgi:carbon monoxide dehydrogenase subunit G